MKLVQLVIAVCAGCALAPQAPDPGRGEPGLPLPRPRGALEFPSGTTEVKLSWLAAELGRLTGQELVMSFETRSALGAASEPLEIVSAVPADEVYAFVEGILFSNQILIAPVKSGSRPMLGLYSVDPRRGPSAPGASPLVVADAQLGELAQHPALLVRLNVFLENVDARMVQTQLRALMTDPTNTEQIVPLGERSLLLQGTAQRVAGMALLLQGMDAASRARAPSPTQPRPGDTPPGDKPPGEKPPGDAPPGDAPKGGTAGLELRFTPSLDPHSGLLELVVAGISEALGERSGIERGEDLQSADPR